MNVLIITESMALWPSDPVRRADSLVRFAAPGSAMVGTGYDLIVVTDLAHDVIAYEPRARAWYEDSILPRLLPGGRVLNGMESPDDDE